ncbi:MAG: hypothetical protein RLW87_07005 [Alphaproteobacteria bacterium]|jgi:Neuraminidase (sialidase)
MRALPAIPTARRTAMVRRAVTAAGLEILRNAINAPGKYQSGNTYLDHNTRQAVQRLEGSGHLDGRGAVTRKGHEILRQAELGDIGRERHSRAGGA